MRQHSLVHPGAPASLLRRWFYPTFIFVRIAILASLFMTFGAGFPPAVLGFQLLTFIVLMAVEQWIPHRPDWSIRGDSQWRNDLGHSIIYLLANGPVIRGVLIGTLIMAFGSETRLYAGVWPNGWPMVAQVMLAMVVHDFLEYWVHRLSHRSALLWPTHVLHHTPDRLHVLKTLRHHWSFAAVRGAGVTLPLLALGTPLDIAAWALFGLLIFGPVAHSNIDVQLSSWTHRVVNTPDLHRVHHSINRADQGSNFCFVLPLWDILFGTYRPPETVTIDRLGAEGNSVSSRFLKQLALVGQSAANA